MGYLINHNIVYDICLHTHLMQTGSKFQLLCSKLSMEENNGTWQLLL